MGRHFNDPIKTIEKLERNRDILERRIDKLIKENERDLQEMAERGKEIEKFANILRGFKDVKERKVVGERLMEIIKGYENRCYLTQKGRQEKKT